MAKSQSASLDRKKLMADPIMVTTIVLLVVFLTIFILYPLAILLVDSFVSDNGLTLDTFKRVMALPNFRRAISNTLKVGFLVGIGDIERRHLQQIGAAVSASQGLVHGRDIKTRDCVVVPFDQLCFVEILCNRRFDGAVHVDACNCKDDDRCYGYDEYLDTFLAEENANGACDREN